MKIHLLVPALALAAIAGLPAQQPPMDGPGGRPPGPSRHGDQGPPPPPPPPPSPVLRALDADDDGILSAAEIKNAPAALLALDKNGDGQLGPKEMGPPPPPPPKPPTDGGKDQTGNPAPGR